MTPRDGSSDDRPDRSDGEGRRKDNSPRRGLLTSLYALFFIVFWFISSVIYTEYVDGVEGFLWAWGGMALPVMVPLYAMVQRSAFRRPKVDRHRWRFFLAACLVTAVLYPGIAILCAFGTMWALNK
jgi:drug/metabolite transporter (DMT)-like permease